ncbi:hypothetical protein C8F01DRAFT_1146060 [Mycena amicta]|nr:hypothetical protein C8F01DRAFT_1146060 [Mycena amicta]
MSSTDPAFMPPEIVSKIFVACLPSTPGPPSPTTAPLLIAQISTLWRDIALDTPALWSTVVLMDDLYASAYILDLWSVRARALPMTYVIRTTQVDLGGAMLAEAMMHKERWGDVEFQLAAPSYAALLHLSGASFPHLRRLSLCGVDSSESEWDPLPTLDLSGGAPELVELRLSNHSFTPEDEIPWGQLKTLQIDGTLDNAAILRSCRSLVQLVLNPAELPIVSEFEVQRAVVHLPHLESLSLSIDTELAQLLSLSRLRHVEIPLTKEVIRYFIRLLPQWGSSYTITSLKVHIITMSEGGSLSTLLTALPALKTLHFEFSGGSSNGLSTNDSPGLVSADDSSSGMFQATATGLLHTGLSLAFMLNVLISDVLVPDLEELQVTWPLSAHTFGWTIADILVRLLSARALLLPGILNRAILVLPGYDRAELPVNGLGADGFRTSIAGTSGFAVKIIGEGNRVLFE